MFHRLRAHSALPFLLLFLCLCAYPSRTQTILISDYDDATVVEYSLCGEFLRQFVSSGAGGLVHPINMRFGPDGNLYVASLDTGEIKKYDGVTGAYLGNFATGIDGPFDIVFDSAGNAYVIESG